MTLANRKQVPPLSGTIRFASRPASVGMTDIADDSARLEPCPFKRDTLASVDPTLADLALVEHPPFLRLCIASFS